MNVKTFIHRPIFACCISVLLVLVGIVGLVNLPIEQYPDIAPPTVTVSATYTGASAETVQKSVIVPLEESINGVENMIYMTSTATNNGEATISVYFKQGTDPDMAAVNVQNRVSKATGQLPSEVTKMGVTTGKRQTSQLKIMSLHATDDRYDLNFLNNYMKIYIKPQIQRIQGVGEVQIVGAEYSMRIWLDPQKMAQYSLVPSDITKVLGEQNIESPTGTLGQQSNNTFVYTMKYHGRYTKTEDFANMVVKSQPDGSVLRVKDVARVELGQSSYNADSEVGGHAGTVCMVMQTAGSNANDIITQIDKLKVKINQDLPDGVVLEDLMSNKNFLDASIGNVVKTLIDAIILVILVVYIFLQSWRATIIPTISVLVSLVATFAFIYIAGFSINLLTLFALVLVIGTVVDDAIVVLEAVQAKFDTSTSKDWSLAFRRQVTGNAMDDITSAIITTSLVFMCVFVPVCFTGGTSGIFYTQFGVTMAVAVGLSAITSLTTAPALCALILRPRQKSTRNADGKLVDAETGGKLTFSSRFHIAFTTYFDRIIGRYLRMVKWMFSHKWMAPTLLGVACALFVFFMKNTKTGLIPDEDTGTIFVSVTASPGYSLQQTKKIVDEVDQRLKAMDQVKIYAKIAGYNMMTGSMSENCGTFIVQLKNWKERKAKSDSKDAVIGQIFARTADIKNAQVFAFAPPQVMGYGVTNGLEIYVQDKSGGTINNLNSVTSKFIAALQKRPEIQSAQTSFDVRFPQYLVDVDAASCKRYNVSPDDVLSVVSGYVGGNYSSDINLYSKIFKVMIQASPEFRLNKDALNNMFVRSSDGNMLPIGQFVKLTKVYGSESLTRYNLFSSILVNASPATGYSSGDAIKAVDEVAKQNLPNGYGYEFSGLSRDEATSSNTWVIYLLCVVFVYIVLCCLYESLLIPLAVMLSIPFGLTGSFIFANIFGLENNIYMQTGLIMLMGLVAKTAILLTEYASECRRRGMGIVEAAFEAAKIRLRPILMTAICMVVGMLPLCVATGAGANGEQSLGIPVVGGLLVGMSFLLVVTPIFFIIMQSIQEGLSGKKVVKETIELE